MKKLTSMLFNLPRRWLYLGGVAIIAGLFGAAMYLEYVLHQEPCPLCMVQRVVFIVMGVLFAIATVHNPKRTGAKVYGVLISLFALFGIAVASRHIWIQHLPKEEVPACSPPLDYMLENLPMAKVLKELMHGSGECATRGWEFLGMGIPEWSLLWYILLGAWALLIVFKASRP